MIKCKFCDLKVQSTSRDKSKKAYQEERIIRSHYKDEHKEETAKEIDALLKSVPNKRICRASGCLNFYTAVYDATSDGACLISYCRDHWPKDRPFDT